MTAKLKLYLLAALFVAGLTFAGVKIYDLTKQLEAQSKAFNIFKTASEEERARIFVRIDSLIIKDKAQEKEIDGARDARGKYQEDFNQLKKQYEKDRINFRAFSDDSLSGYFAKRRGQR